MQEYIINVGEKSIYGTLFRPNTEGKCPLVILSHGYNGIGQDFMRECETLVRNGFAAYAFDFCGGSTRSRSSGKSTDMTLFTEKEDLTDVFEHFEALDFVDKNRIYLLGGSQGGLVTALAAAELTDRVTGVVLYFPALCIPDNWRHRFDETGIPEAVDFWGLTLGKGFFTSMKDLYPLDVIGGYKGPVLIIQGDKDSVVLMEDSEKATALYDKCTLIVLSDEGHGFSPEGTKIAISTALKFMVSSVKKTSFERRFYHVLMSASCAHRDASYTGFQKLGLSEGQPKALCFLSDYDGDMQKDLADRCNVKPSTMTVLLDRMEYHGYIERRTVRSGLGKNAKRIYLTQKGKEKAQDVIDFANELDEKALHGFTDDEKEQLISMLEKVTENLKK